MALLRQVEGQWGVSPKADIAPLLTTHQEPASLERIKHKTLLSRVKYKLETELKSGLLHKSFACTCHEVKAYLH
jgi:hypothetical protein